MATTSQKRVKLGFIEEETDPYLLKSHFFPSKIGGRPSWLSLNPIPDPTDLKCSKCNEQTRFLMQVYAPLERDDAFHRTIFIFMCTNPSCSSTKDVSDCFIAFRSQLPLNNEFYSSTPPDEVVPDNPDVEEHPHAGQFNSLCRVCGVKGPKKCSQCKVANYCSKNHQVIDWKAGHKQNCFKVFNLKTDERNDGSSSNNNIKTINDSASGFLKMYQSELFREVELVTEDEEEPGHSDTNNSKSEAERMKEFDNLKIDTSECKEAKNFSLKDLESTAKAETEDDREFLNFKERVRDEPSQVLRYSRLDKPLWVSAYEKSTVEDIPDCRLCGSKRVFEFQIMPQLLNHLQLDRLEQSVDWGTLCVYTCRDSCHIGNDYHREFIWKQDFHNPTKD